MFWEQLLNIHSFSIFSAAARAFGLPEPQHPLICMLGAESTQVIERNFPQSHVLNFYKISYKPRLSGRVRYGQHYYDFDEGGLLFAALGQVISVNVHACCKLQRFLAAVFEPKIVKKSGKKR